MSVAVPAIALVGTCIADYGWQHPQPDPVATSLATLSWRTLENGTPQTDADGADRMPSPTASPSPTVQPSPAATTSPAPAPPAPTCGGGAADGTGLLPFNYATIVNFLVAHGYTAMGAVGIAGNIYQESKGDPESVGTGGGGLIGWSPLPAGLVTGNAVADLQTQLTALLSYNQQWSQYVAALNAAATPSDAAYIYMTYFERPGLPAAANREGAAVAIAQACGIG
jgi:hypothetical protein